MKLAIAIGIALLAIALGVAFLLNRKDDTTAPNDNAANAASSGAPNIQDATLQAPPQPPPAVAPVAVRIGSEPELDACSSSGKVVGLSRDGDNFLSVRAAPDVRALETDRLKPEADFYMCDGAKDDAWVGIVYAPGGKLGDGCGVTSPIAKEEDYAGACRSGWVSRKFVQLVAG